ncbi:MAG: lactate utilization protein [Pirellulales bacterium]|nr:lactate utilization protein [Pirellulales bacterium]
MKREEFLARVRGAAAAGRAYRVHVRDDIPARVGYVGAGPNPAERLAAEMNAVGGFAQLVDSEEAARAALAELLVRYSPKSALCWQHPLLERLGLAALLETHGVEHWSHDLLAPLDQPTARAKMFAAEIGITSATWAIAETGSLLMAATGGRERTASLLPPVHVAIVERAQIVPDLFDAYAQLEAAGVENLASNVTLITGPSKTGDLELKLTTGVHGPGKWHVIIVR